MDEADRADRILGISVNGLVAKMVCFSASIFGKMWGLVDSAHTHIANGMGIAHHYCRLFRGLHRPRLAETLVRAIVSPGSTVRGKRDRARCTLSAASRQQTRIC